MTIAPIRPVITRQDIVDEFQRSLWLPDPGIIDVTLATVAGNRMTGESVWTVLVGAPSSGKSITLGAVSHLPEIHEVDSFTEAGLLSGSSDGTPGLLTQMGAYGILVFPDLTVLLSKGSPERSGSFGMLRRVYDGAFERRIGSKGGSLEWEGKAGCLAAVTEAVFLTDLGVMGERFLYFPLPRASDSDRVLAGYSVLENLGTQPELRGRRTRLVTDFFAGLELPESPPAFEEADQDRLVVLADLGARCRSPIVRDRYKGDAVELVPDAEHLARLLGALGQLAAGMRVIGTPDAELWRLVGQVAVGGVHPTRRRIIEFLVLTQSPHSTAVIAGRCRLPQSTIRRVLEDLTALGVVDLVGDHPECWTVTGWLRERWAVVSASQTTGGPS